MSAHDHPETLSGRTEEEHSTPGVGDQPKRVAIHGNWVQVDPTRLEAGRERRGRSGTLGGRSSTEEKSTHERGQAGMDSRRGQL
jgi:hypothetical protein